jgi:hypothetical protein
MGRHVLLLRFEGEEEGREVAGGRGSGIEKVNRGGCSRSI